MKISQIRTYKLSYPLEESFSNSSVWCTHRTAGVVEIVTDAGITGWGEGSSAPAAAALEPHLLGRDPFDTEVLWTVLDRAGFSGAQISGVDIALWDVIGKALQQPIYRLLGGAYKKKIPAYASGLFNKKRADITQDLMDEAKGYADQGFGAVKMKIGLGEEYDLKNVAAVRRAIGAGVQLAVDANCGYDVGSAAAVGRKIAECDLLWYEEPIGPQDVEGYVELRRTLPMRLAGGEGLQGLRAFRGLLQSRALDIVQPDISIAGGFSACRKIAALASANWVRVFPHMWGTSLRLAATLHWQATLPDDPAPLNPFPSLFEFDMTENKLRTELALEPILCTDGFVEVPEAPGLGIEVDRGVLERYAV